MRVQRQRPGLGRLIVVTAIVLPSLSGAPPAGARDLFDELYERGQKQNGALRTLTAIFTEASTSPLLTKPMVARGTVAVERPARVALRYTEPDERVVIIDGDRMTVTWPSRRIRAVKDIGATQRKIQKYFVNGSPDELRSHFQITAQEAEDRPGAYLVTMVARRKQIQEGLTRLDLWVDRTSLLLSAMLMTFPTGDTKLMTFTAVTPNAALHPDVFKAGDAVSQPR